MAFYCMLAEADYAAIFAIEKQMPYRTGRFVVDMAMVYAEIERIESALYEYAACVESDAWPTGYEDFRIVGRRWE